MSKELTEQQKKDYISNPTECPYCNSEEISSGDFEPEIMTVEVECQSCNSKWLECLKLVDITEAY